tara:strand:+ start:11413 stop:13131 length:1719 start_codon:yes stop_codon:yes gene_type:complete
MSIVIRGDGVSKGVCIGGAVIMNRDNIDYAPSFIKKSQINREVQKFQRALADIKTEYNKSKDKVKDNATIIKLMETQLAFVEDGSFKKNVINRIEKKLHTAVWAISSEYQIIKDSFDDIEDKYIKERLIDIQQLVISILDFLQSNKEQNKFDNIKLENKIIVTEEITPKDIIDIYHNKGLGVITSHGSVSSHSAILSRSLSLPMIVKAESAKKIIKNNDILIMDLDNQIILINPDAVELEHFRNKQSEKTSIEKDLRKILKKKTITTDNVKISIMSNLELSEEVKYLKNDCDGIGLFRTEYLYMNRNDLPTEEEQLLAYKKVFKKMKNKPVTLRTLDIGSDKEVSENIKVGEIAKNPALGLRGIRYSLSEKNIFKTQIRAMLQAGYNANLNILLPMITSCDEIQKAKELIHEVELNLKKDKKKFNNKYNLGIMIEVPASALQADSLSKHVDFMSIGTNDLVQYTLAIDRIDDEVSNLFDPTNPSVLALIKKVITSCNKSKIDVTVCGEMAGEIIYTKLLLGLGLKSFSMHPQAMLEVKNIVLKSDTSKIKRKISAILKCDDISHRKELIKSL